MRFKNRTIKKLHNIRTKPNVTAVNPTTNAPKSCRPYDAMSYSIDSEKDSCWGAELFDGVPTDLNPEFVPTNYEMLMLAEYWATAALLEWQCNNLEEHPYREEGGFRHAGYRLAELAATLGDEAFHYALRNALRKFAVWQRSTGRPVESPALGILPQPIQGAFAKLLPAGQ